MAVCYRLPLFIPSDYIYESLTSQVFVPNNCALLQDLPRLLSACMNGLAPLSLTASLSLSTFLSSHTCCRFPACLPLACSPLPVSAIECLPSFPHLGYPPVSSHGLALMSLHSCLPSTLVSYDWLPLNDPCLNKPKFLLAPWSHSPELLHLSSCTTLPGFLPILDCHLSPLFVAGISCLPSCWNTLTYLQHLAGLVSFLSYKVLFPCNRTESCLAKPPCMPDCLPSTVCLLIRPHPGLP